MHPSKSCLSYRLFCCSRSLLDVKLSDSVDAGDGADWDRVVESASPFLQRDYLRAQEVGLFPDEALRYARFYEKGQLVGVACFQLTRFQGKPLDELFRTRPLMSFLAGFLSLKAAPLSFRVLVCGNPLASGEHGFHFVSRIVPQRAMDSLLHALATVRTELEQATSIDGILIKDLPPAAAGLQGFLRGHGYAELNPEPTMVLRLDPAWDSFDSYLACLASKYRVKAKRAYAKSQALEVRALSAEDLLAHQARLVALHEAVCGKAEYQLGSLGFSTLLSLRRTLGEGFVLRGYFLQGVLVGFLTGFVRGGRLEAHQVGFDYALNAEHAIYPRMLCDYLQLAIERRCHTLNYGRTASEIKSTLGAEPVEMRCYLRHRGYVPNHIARIVAPRLQPESEPLRMPFTKEWYGMRAVQS